MRPRANFADCTKSRPCNERPSASTANCADVPVPEALNVMSTVALINLPSPTATISVGASQRLSETRILRCAPRAVKSACHADPAATPVPAVYERTTPRAPRIPSIHAKLINLSKTTSGEAGTVVASKRMGSSLHHSLHLGAITTSLQAIFAKQNGQSPQRAVAVGYHACPHRPAKALAY